MLDESDEEPHECKPRRKTSYRELLQEYGPAFKKQRRKEPTFSAADRIATKDGQETQESSQETEPKHSIDVYQRPR